MTEQNTCILFLIVFIMCFLIGSIITLDTFRAILMLIMIVCTLLIILIPLLCTLRAFVRFLIKD